MRYTLTVLLTFIALSASAQDRFTRIFNQDTTYSMSIHWAQCYPIQTTADGGHLLQYYGNFVPLSGELPALTQYIIKTDSNFYPQWKLTDIPVAIAMKSNFIFNCINNFHDTAIAIAKLNLDGSTVWMKTLHDNDSGYLGLLSAVNLNSKIRYTGVRVVYGSPGSNVPVFVDIDSTGAIIAADSIAGDTVAIENQFTDDSGNSYLLTDHVIGGGDRKITKLRPDNSIVWSYILHKQLPYDITGMAALPNGDVIFSGSYRSYTDSIDAFLIKFSATGTLIWDKIGDRNSNISDIALMPNGNIMIAAAGASLSFEYYNYHSYLIEIDTAANVKWAKNISPDASRPPVFIGHSVPYIRSSNDWYYAALKNDPLAPVVYNTDSNGNGHCSSIPTAYSFYDTTLFTLIPSTIDFAPISLSVFNVADIDSVQPQLFIDSCDYTAPTAVINTTVQPDINIYPNPASNTFSIQNTSNISSVEIFDMAGRLVSCVAENNSFDKIDISRLKNGYYIIRLTGKDNHIVYKKLVVIN